MKESNLLALKENLEVRDKTDSLKDMIETIKGNHEKKRDELVYSPRCNNCGKCCESFHLPFSIRDLEDKKRILKDSPSLQFYGENKELKEKIFLDFVEHVPWEEKHKEVSIHSILSGVESKHEEHFTEVQKGSLYRCKLYKKGDDGNGYCSVHENRPDICRNYAPGSKENPKGYLDQNSLFFKGCSYIDWIVGTLHQKDKIKSEYEKGKGPEEKEPVQNLNMVFELAVHRELLRLLFCHVKEVRSLAENIPGMELDRLYQLMMEFLRVGNSQQSSIEVLNTLYSSYGIPVSEFEHLIPLFENHQIKES